MKDAEMILLEECCNTKSTREAVINKFLNDYTKLSQDIIKHYNLKRFNDKYITEHRNFTENSYSKKKIREEEILFIRKIYTFSQIVTEIEEHNKLEKEADTITNRYVTSNLSLDRIFFTKLFREVFGTEEEADD